MLPEEIDNGVGEAEQEWGKAKQGVVEDKNPVEGNPISPSLRRHRFGGGWEIKPQAWQQSGSSSPEGSGECG